MALKKGQRPPPASGFVIVEEKAVAGLMFGTSKRKESPYFNALKLLAQGGPGKLLCFEQVGARNQIAVQAKKHAIKVMFAEQGDKLYVRLENAAGPEGVLQAFLEDGPRSIDDITRHLATFGMADNVTGLLADLSRNDQIKLETVGNSKKWKLTKASGT